MPRPDVAPGTVVVYSDVVCGWATTQLHRFRRARRRRGLDDRITLDLRLFLLEDVNRFPLPMRLIQAEIPVYGRLEPDIGWTPWQGDLAAWPVSSLLANEAVQAAKLQSARAADEVDEAFRLAFFRDSRCITMRHEVLDIAGSCPSVDADALREALDRGTARGAMIADYESHRDDVQGSPHFFFADGTDVHNPGIELHWQGEPEKGFPVVDRDESAVWDELIERAIDG